MLTIAKEKSEMVVTEEDFKLIYKNTGWIIVGSADPALEEEQGKRIHVDSDTEFVAAPQPLVLEGTHEGETIVEDEAGNPTKLGKEKRKDTKS